MLAKRGLLERALAGRMEAHQRCLLTEQLCHIDALDEGIARVSGEIAERMRPFADALERLDTIPGIGQRMAEILVAEIGTDMRRFPSAAHLASWAGMCPGNQESAGKRKTGRTCKGNVWLRAALVEAAHSLGRGRGTYLAAQLPVPLEYWDERFTTVEAARLLRASGVAPRKQRDQIDATAAAILLQSYLDSHAPPRRPWSPAPDSPAPTADGPDIGRWDRRKTPDA